MFPWGRFGSKRKEEIFRRLEKDSCFRRRIVRVLNDLYESGHLREAFMDTKTKNKVVQVWQRSGECNRKSGWPLIALLASFLIGTDQEMQSSAWHIGSYVIDGEGVIPPRGDKHVNVKIVVLAGFGNVSNGAGDFKANERVLATGGNHDGCLCKCTTLGKTPIKITDDM